MPGLKKYFNEAVEFHNELMLYPKMAFDNEYVTFKVKLLGSGRISGIVIFYIIQQSLLTNSHKHYFLNSWYYIAISK